MTERLSDSLAEIDPNTENGVEGIAFVRKIYKMKGVKPLETKPTFPETDKTCVNQVAGKVLQIEALQEDLDSQASFTNFFADIYCGAYVNGLVTSKDGLSQIFPGGLDLLIEMQIKRIYGENLTDSQMVGA